MGKESDGLSEGLVTRLDHKVSIPMQSGVDSFSVNAAAAALLCEALRQKMQ
jgi:tRNA G18 (ribose-2'-O)-methylase SpoU